MNGRCGCLSGFAWCCSGGVPGIKMPEIRMPEIKFPDFPSWPRWGLKDEGWEQPGSMGISGMPSLEVTRYSQFSILGGLEHRRS